jgi:putative oxidoreductase
MSMEDPVIRLPRAVVWACAIFVAVSFVVAGFSKLEGPSAMRWSERFAHWGYAVNVHYLVGVLEVLGGLGVLIPKWRRAAAATLVGLMLGAVSTHALNAEFPRLIPPLVLGALALLVSSAHPARRQPTPDRE